MVLSLKPRLPKTLSLKNHLEFLTYFNKHIYVFHKKHSCIYYVYYIKHFEISVVSHYNVYEISKCFYRTHAI